MSRTAISAEAKAAMRANLELEISARKEKLLAMCEAQCASLRSRLERRVNRVPSNKRKLTMIEIMEPPPPQKLPPAKKAKEIEAPAPVPSPARKSAPVPAPAPAPAARRGRAATTTTAPAAKARAAPKAAMKTTRGVKRVSDEISADDKENNADLAVPKKRTKAAAAPRPTRATRAASKKDPSPQILSPKTNNARPAAQTRTRRIAQR